MADSVWVPILEIGHDTWVGVVGGNTYVGSNEAPIRRVDPARPTGLLPCLEMSRESIIAKLRERARELGLAEDALAEAVPLDALPAEAVRSEMDYWAQLALRWLALTPGDQLSDDLLRTVERADWTTQNTRQLATRLLKQKRN
jgi:hypothetical protein